MGERTQILMGVHSILDIHEEYGMKASRIVKTDETLNYGRVERSSQRLARNLTNAVKASIVQSTDKAIERTLERLNAQMVEVIGMPLSTEQKAQIATKVKKRQVGAFRGLTLSQRLKNSRDVVQKRMTQYARDGMIREQQGVNKIRARSFINTPSSQGLIAGGSIVNRNSRLAISEVNRAEQNTVKAFLEENDLPGRWELSGNHKKRDICDNFAEGTGEKAFKLFSKAQIQFPMQGVYLASEMPQYPHPYCECHIEPIFGQDFGMTNVTRKQVFENIGEELTESQKDAIQLEGRASDYYKKWRENELRYGSAISTPDKSRSKMKSAVKRLETRLTKALETGKGVRDSALENAMRRGGYRAYTSIASDLGLNALPQEIIDQIGVENALRLMADDIKKAGYDKEAIEALRASLETDVERALRESQRVATSQLKEIQAVKKAFTDGEISRRSAQRQRALLLQQAREELGDAVGYSKTTQDLLSALENPAERKFLAIDVSSKAQAKKLAQSLGIAEKDWKVLSGKKLVIDETGISVVKSFGEGKEMTISQKAQRIRTAKIPENWRAHVIKTTYIDQKTGEEKALKMLPTQQRGAKFIAKQQTAFVNYPVGSGKTLTSIGGIGELQAEGKAKKVLYVTVNNGLAVQYADEVATFSNLTVTTVKGTHFDYANTNKLITAISKNQLVRDFEAIKVAGYDTVVIDEAHTFMTPMGKAKTVPIDLIRNLTGVKNKVAMTGTPVVDRLDSVYDIVKWLNPEAVGTKAQFASKYGNLGKLSTVAQRQGQRELKTMMEPFLITGGDAKRKGKLVKKVVNVPLNAEDKSYLFKLAQTLDSQVKSGEISRRQARKVLVQRQEALINGRSTAKISAVQKLLEQTPDGKVVIHVQSSRARNQLLKALSEENEKIYIAKSGGLTGKKIIDAFQKDTQARVMIVGSQLNTGVNLDFADTAILYDRPQSSYIMKQLQGRTHRGLKATNTTQYILQTQTDYDRELTRSLAQSKSEMKVMDALSKLSDSELKRVFSRLMGSR